MDKTKTAQAFKVIPLQKELFMIPSSPLEKPTLIGSRCKLCKRTFFPKRDFCARGCAQEMEIITLSSKGKIFTFTIVTRKGKLSLIEPPYIEVEVELPEGPHVFTVLSECDPESVIVGMEVELVVEKIQENENGDDIVTFKFRPVS